MLKRDKQEIVNIAREKLIKRDKDKLLYDSKLWTHWKNTFCGHAQLITSTDRNNVTCPNCLKHIIDIYKEVNYI